MAQERRLNRVPEPITKEPSENKRIEVDTDTGLVPTIEELLAQLDELDRRLTALEDRLGVDPS